MGGRSAPRAGTCPAKPEHGDTNRRSMIKFGETRIPAWIRYGGSASCLGEKRRFFPFRRVEPCLWLIPCLKVNSSLASSGFAKINMALCDASPAQARAHTESPQLAMMSEGTGNDCLGLGATLIAATTLAAVYLLIDIDATRAPGKVRVF